jgi:hypothetical protein
MRRRIKGLGKAGRDVSEVPGAPLLRGGDLLLDDLDEAVVVTRLRSCKTAFQHTDFGGKGLDFHPFERTHRRSLTNILD